MPTENRNEPKSLLLTYISIFAALNVLADFVPFTPIIGFPGAYFRLGWVLSPLTGILLGPEAGGISCLIGGLIEIFPGILQGQPLIFGPFTPLRPAISAFIAGMLASKNWRMPAMTLFTLILVWLLLPAGRDAYAVLVFHITGLAIIVVLRGKIGDLIGSKTTKMIPWGLFLAAYCGNISRHLFGNILFVAIQNMPPYFFIVAIPYTLIEQLTFAVGSMVIGTPIIRLRLRKLIQLS